MTDKDVAPPDSPAKEGEFVGAEQPRTGDNYTVVTQRYQGPLPSAAEMAGYERTLAGLADRITRMAELEQKHRHEREQRLTDANIALAEQDMSTKRRGQILGFCIAVMGMALSGYIAHLGHPVYGLVGGGSVLVSLVAVFVIGKRISSKDESDEPDE